MLQLAWANVSHHKLRSALAALAVGIGIMLMLVSHGLASGSLAEVDQRMQSVDAELVVLPAQDTIILTNGAPFLGVHERFLRTHADSQGPLAESVVPVFFGQVKMAGMQQRLFGVDPAQMGLFLGPRRVVAGKLFDRAPELIKRLGAGQRPPNAEDDLDAFARFLDDGLELVIDERLQKAGHYEVGQKIQILGYPFRIVGVVEAGVAGRAFVPLQTLREITVAGEPRATTYFIKLRRGLDVEQAVEQLQDKLGPQVRIERKSDYGRMLRDSFASISTYMSASSGVALAVCFLFILLTMYTMVLERTREIGILKSLGVTRFGLLRLTLIEAVLISSAGVGAGVALAFGARTLLGALVPLLTVELAPARLGLAALIGVGGGALSALYPGLRAARLDPAAALTNE